MRKAIIGIGATVGAVLSALLLAPSVWARPLPVDPVDPVSTVGPAASSSGGISVWQIVAIALVAAAIGAVGSYVAQRTHRHAETGAISVA